MLCVFMGDQFFKTARTDRDKSRSKLDKFGVERENRARRLEAWAFVDPFQEIYFGEILLKNVQQAESVFQQGQMDRKLINLIDVSPLDNINQEDVS
jgi:hypothetical protein